jgi:PAS domain S-box-containing protein
LKISNTVGIDRVSWPIRTLLGCGSAIASVAVTYGLKPLHSFPLLLAFPTVVLSAWFLGMAGSFGCAILTVTLVDLLLTREEFRFDSGFTQQELRLSLFLVLSTLLGVLLRRWADQRVELREQDLKKSLVLAQTQRQMAEERARAGEALRDRDAALQIALEASGMGFWTWDLHRDLVHWSDEMYRIIGYAPGEFSPVNEAWLRAIHPEDADDVRRGIDKVVATGEDFRRQYRVLWPDGAVRWVESQGRCLRDNDGRAHWLMGVITDVTHRKRAEESMLRAEKLAVAGRLAASVAHEINNPLEAVTNLLYLITMSSSADESKTLARNALDELLRVSMITQSTLKFHRQQGMPKITMLSEVVEGVMTLFRPRFISANIVAEVQAANEVAIACMPSEAQQIFANLISNSIEALPGPGKITIRLRPSRDWRNREVAGMRATIADTGVGMDRATMRRIFEPFFTTKPETGTGLGMWVVAQLVERHGGAVRVRSTQRYGAGGTTFSIFLPTVHPAEATGVAIDAESGALSVDSPMIQSV